MEIKRQRCGGFKLRGLVFPIPQCIKRRLNEDRMTADHFGFLVLDFAIRPDYHFYFDGAR